MRVQERAYRVLLLAHPRRHRREYGEAMVQLMRDRLRDDSGGLRTILVWWSLLVDLAQSAAIERMAVVRAQFRSSWWRTGAVVVAAVLAVGAVHGLFEPATGAWYQYILGRAALVVAPIAIVTGLVIRTRHQWQGSALVGVGVLPGAMAVVLFWYPPALVFGILSIAVACAAADDVDRIRRAGLTVTEPTSPSTRSANGPG